MSQYTKLKEIIDNWTLTHAGDYPESPDFESTFDDLFDPEWHGPHMLILYKHGFRVGQINAREYKELKEYAAERMEAEWNAWCDESLYFAKNPSESLSAAGRNPGLK